MARILLFFLILNSASSGKAQIGFSNTYDFGTPFARSANLIIDGDSLWLSGVTSTPDTPYQQVFFFNRLDSFGHVLALNTFADSLGDAYVMENFFKVTKKVSTGFLLAGKAFYRRSGILAKLYKTGAVDFIREYPDTTILSILIRNVCETNDGYLIGGSKRRLGYSVDFFIIKMDKEGEINWENNYVAAGSDDALNSLWVIGPNTYVAGGTRASPQNTPLSEQWSRGVIFAVDSLGAVKWSWEPPTEWEQAGIVGLRPTADGGWIYITYKRTLTGTSLVDFRPIIVKLDSLMAIDWVFQTNPPVNSGFFNAFFDLAPTPDGGWVAAGWMLDESGLNLQGALYKISAEGDSVWSRLDTAFSHPVFGAENALHDVEVLSSGSIMACGYSREYIEEEQRLKSHAWLLKVSADGCIVEGCRPVNAVQEERPVQPALQLFPNPAGKAVVLDTGLGGGTVPALLEMHNSQGQLALARKLTLAEGQVEVDISHLAEGWYTVRLLSGAGLQAGRLVVQR
ncbi:MAG: T9SS type A sorting domain-containing protein [Phaeodactylibacter sp.]|nr:T9SS type A sorting domain-containing protein [Phaeodactylibacter sp.]